MREIRYTLISDGSSDRMLMPILEWLLRSSGVAVPIQQQWPDFGRVPDPPRELWQKMIRAVDLFPCEVLFVHRDAEGQERDQRVREIRSAEREAAKQTSLPAVVPVVPVRMQEAWLLFDERAIRCAAGNPGGREELALPPLAQVERKPDPKNLLFDCIARASGLKGRRLKSLNVRKHAFLVSEYIADFSPLRALDAFRALEEEVTLFVKQLKPD